MVVIPQHRRVLLVWVVIDRRFPRNNPILGIAVTFRWHFSAMKVYHRSHFGLVRASPAEVMVNGEKVLVGKLVNPLDHNFLPAADVERGSRKLRAETPHAG